MDDTSLSNPEWNYSLDTSGFTDGSHLIRFDAIGGATGTDVVTIPVKFDNNGPSISNVSSLYPQGQVNAKPGDVVTITAKVIEPVSFISTVTCDASSLGSSSAVTMYDDGLHNDGAPNDNTYGTPPIEINTTGGYWAGYIHATDTQSNLRNVTAAVNVDQYEPTILEINTELPAGQTAVRNGDNIRVTAKALDYKIIISDKVKRKPLDVVLVLDNSGSMRGTPWTDLENAAKTFIDTLADNDRCAIVSFDAQGDPEAVKQYSTFLTMSETYNDPQGSAYTSTGRNVSKYIVTQDDGLHLTKYNPWFGYIPNCWTTIWDAIGKGIQYAINSRRTDAVPVVIAMTDGDDFGSGNGREHGSETYCPGAFNGATGQTWVVSGGNIWNSPQRSYPSIQREIDTNPFNALTTVTFGSTSPESTRTGLINATIPVFTIGLSISPQGSNSSALNYLPPTASSYKYTTEFDLFSIANTSVTGRYYFAPNSNQLTTIYNNVSQVIQKYGVETLGLKQPHGIASVQADFSSIGISLKVNMFDDGKHGDGKADDNIYGSDPVTVNSVDSGTLVFNVEGTDKAGNFNNTQFTLELDNTQPTVHTVNTSYPPDRDKAQDGYSIYVKANCTDGQTGLGQVFLDASNIGGASAVPMVDDGTGNDEFAFDGFYTSHNVTVATGLASGIFTITVNAYDKAGNKGSQSGNIIIYNDVDITMANLLADQIITGNYQIIANITDPDGIPETSTNPRYRVDLNPWNNMSLLSGTNFAAILNTSQYLDGTHTLYVHAKDSYGAESTIGTDFIVDNTPPSSVSVISPVPNDFIEGDYSFKCIALDAIGIQNVTLTITNSTGHELVSNATMGFNSLNGYYQYIFGTAILNDGTYTLSIYARDLAGHETVSSNLSFNIDNNNPSLILNHPKNGNFVAGVVEINVTVIEEFLDKVEYNVDSSGWVNISELWDTIVIEDGSHSIEIRALDQADHEVSITINVKVDNNNPICSVIKPFKNEFINGKYTLRAHASDKVGIKDVKFKMFYMDPPPFYSEKLNSTMYFTGSGNYEYLLDTTLFPDGFYMIYTFAEDLPGNITFSDNIEFQIDNDAPEFIINDPFEGKIVDGLVDIDVTITNEKFLHWIRYNIDNSGWINVAEPWNTSRLPDGAHTIRLGVDDLAGHFVEESINVIVDNENPVCEIVAPIENQYIENTFTFRILASDAVGVELVELSVFYKMIEAVHNSENGYYEYSIDTRFLEDGKYNITATCYDIANRSTSSSLVNFRIDNKFPILQVSSPLNGIFVAGDVEFDLKVDDAFPAVTEYNIDGNGWIPYQINPVWNSSTVVDGEHILEIRSTDPVGHVATQKIILFVDNFAPSAAVHSPALNQFIEGIHTFKVLATDEVGMAYVELTMFGETVKATYNSMSNYFEYTVSTTTKDDGLYEIMVTAYDRSGKNVSVGPVGFYIDNHAPVMNINFPTSNQFVSDEITFDLEVNDTFKTSTFYNIDGSGWVPIDVEWITNRIADGEHSIAIKSIDAAGHEIEQLLTVNVDNTPPKLSIVLPKDNDNIGGVYTVKAHASDTFGIKTVVLSIDGGYFTEIAQNPSTGLFELPIDTTKLNLEDGVHVLSVEAQDNVLHISKSSINIVVDNSPPMVNLSYPRKDDGEIKFVINATDLSGVDEVLINIDGTGWRQFTKYEDINDTYRYIWHTTKSDNGFHVFEVKIIDELGNEEILSGTVKVDNEVKADYLGFFLDILPLIVFVVFIILLIIGFLMFRRGTFNRWLDKARRRGESDGKSSTDRDRDLDETLDDDEDSELSFSRGGYDDEDEYDDYYSDYGEEAEEGKRSWFGSRKTPPPKSPPKSPPKTQSYGSSPRPSRATKTPIRKTSSASVPRASGRTRSAARSPVKPVRKKIKVKPKSSKLQRF
jgi:hypothetical protein